jgi:hypothetical protein
MRTSRLLFVPAALLLAAPAGAQKSPAAPGSAHAPAATLPKGAAAAWTGTPSKWGGSPPAPARTQSGYTGQPVAYIPIVVAAPYPVPAYADTTCTQPYQASVEMPVVTTRHEERQLTTVEVYRLQPRFQKP